MASASVSMALPLTPPTHNKLHHHPSSVPFLRTRLVNKSQSKPKLGAIHIRASLKEKTLTGLTAAAITASMVIPEVAHAAGNDFSPSLKNFLLSIAAGGVVLTAIFGAVIGVSNFDPVKRT